MIASALDRRNSAASRADSPHLFARRLIGTLGALVAAGTGTAPSHAIVLEDITGVWLTDGNEAAIEIKSCGEQRCGRVAWMRDPVGDDGQVPTDRRNPDPSLRSRPICGLTIISGLKPQDDGSWGQGRVYNPDSGKTYDLEIRRTSPEILRITGYVGLKFLGQWMDWRRAPKDLGTCSKTMLQSPKR
ncbi:DUF2147 domain-containing protein [Microvirga massiliensis]|uniref:DUF2147 domain-containing protein n=1 Tax=Microvirga massiliensis TaxID=1033741 RepID=UPI000661130B|nr:DUF2147 domain-containing protein [Microvirga massiliensis]